MLTQQIRLCIWESSCWIDIVVIWRYFKGSREHLIVNIIWAEQQKICCGKALRWAPRLTYFYACFTFYTLHFCSVPLVFESAVLPCQQITAWPLETFRLWCLKAHVNDFGIWTVKQMFIGCGRQWKQDACKAPCTLMVLYKQWITNVTYIALHNMLEQGYFLISYYEAVLTHIHTILGM